MLELTVKEKVKETAEAVTLILEPKASFQYKAGQFLNIETVIGGQKERRSYSFSSSPSKDKLPAITVKKVNNGKVSTYLVDNIQIGDSIQAVQVSGIFTLDKSRNSNAVFVGGGSGITPLISMIKEALLLKKYQNITLVYSNRNSVSEIFLNEINQLESQYTNFKVVRFYSQESHDSCRLNQSQFIKFIETDKSIDCQKTDYFLCGPDGLMHEVKSALSVLNVSKENIFQEVFTSTKSGDEIFADSTTSADVSLITVIYQGTEYKFNVDPKMSILESALKQDIDLPYSCMSGMCTACMGKCKSGKVEMAEQDGLSDTEIKSGYVLTCVGRPMEANTIIEID